MTKPIYELEEEAHFAAAKKITEDEYGDKPIFYEPHWMACRVVGCLGECVLDSVKVYREVFEDNRDDDDVLPHHVYAAKPIRPRINLTEALPGLLKCLEDDDNCDIPGSVDEQKKTDLQQKLDEWCDSLGVVNYVADYNIAIILNK